MSVALAAPEEESAWVGAKRTLPAVGLAGACAFAALTPVGDDDGQILCPFRLATGLWCPGCGCTRALSALVRGDVTASLSFNPWTLLIVSQALVLSGWFLAAPDTARRWWARNDMGILKLNLAVGVLIWITRLSTGTLT